MVFPWNAVVVKDTVFLRRQCQQKGHKKTFSK
jgi:hypothetical protein